MGLQKRNINFLAPSRQELDLVDRNAVNEYLAFHEPTLIIHCAALVGGIAANVKRPADFVLSNLEIDTSLLSAARKSKVKNLIYFGSSCMYPRNVEQPMQESYIMKGELEPTNEGYALAKISASKIVESISRQDDLNWRVLILSNLYGPRDNFDPLESHLVASIIRKMDSAILNHDSNVEIWGSGTSCREFTFVEDVSEFVISNFSSISSWPVVMNLGSGLNLSVNEYYRRIGELMGYQGEFSNNFKMPDGMPQKLLDSGKAKSIGWNPGFDFQSGMLETIKWYRESVKKV